MRAQANKVKFSDEVLPPVINICGSILLFDYLSSKGTSPMKDVCANIVSKRNLRYTYSYFVTNGLVTIAIYGTCPTTIVFVKWK